MPASALDLGLLTTPPRWATLALAVFAGGALWAAFPDFGAWPLAVLALLLAQLALTRNSARWNFLVGYAMGAVFWLPHLYWVIDATEVVPWLVLALVVCAPFFGAFGALWTWARRWTPLAAHRWWYALSFALVWTGVEEWRARIPFGGFPWGRLAWAAAGAPVGRAAWLGGSVLVTLLLALAAGLVGSLLLVPQPSSVRFGRHQYRQRGAVLAFPMIAALACVFAPLLLPLPRDNAIRAVANPPATTFVAPPDRTALVDAGAATAQVGTLNVGFAQGSNSNPGGDAAYNAQEVLDNHLAETAFLAADVRARELGPDDGYTSVNAQLGAAASVWVIAPTLDVVVWPEDSTGWNPAAEPLVAQMLDRARADVGAPLLLGSQELPAGGGRYNVMLLWDDGVISRYAKQRPVPFGEYMPLRSVLRRLSAQVDRVQIDMIAAENPPIIELPVDRLGRNVPLGVGICFEVAWDDIFRQAVRDGAEVIFVPTNNASFGQTAQSTQQLAMTQLQAIATGRAAAQISTVGVSGVFAPDGTLVARAGLFQPDRISAVLPLRTAITPAVRLGAAPGIAVQVMAIALPAAGLLGRRVWPRFFVSAGN